MNIHAQGHDCCRGRDCLCSEDCNQTPALSVPTYTLIYQSNSGSIRSVIHGCANDLANFHLFSIPAMVRTEWRPNWKLFGWYWINDSNWKTDRGVGLVWPRSEHFGLVNEQLSSTAIKSWCELLSGFLPRDALFACKCATRAARQK
jgi:hypothetical protein